jgi:hypothetical protein
MSILNKLERRFGRYTFPHLLPVLLVSQLMVYVAEMTRMVPPGSLHLEGRYLLQGRELYRMFTFMAEPMDNNHLFFFIGLYVTWLMGGALEREWGEFRFNLFLGVGWAGTVLASLLLPWLPMTNFFIMASLTLAFARLYPDFEFLMFFLIPLKVKYIAYVMWAGFVFLLLVPGIQLMVFAGAVLPYMLFFGRETVTGFRGRQRTRSFRKQAAIPKDKAFHTCSRCGVTDRDNPDLAFRYLPGDQCVCEGCLEKESSS